LPIELSHCDTEFDWTAPRRGAVVVLQLKETINDQATSTTSIAPQATCQRSWVSLCLELRWSCTTPAPTTRRASSASTRSNTAASKTACRTTAAQA